MIETRAIVKSFGAQRVLDGVTLRIQRGEAVVIIGRSGCGKSVLLKHLIGLLRPEAGQVLIAGQDITQLPERDLLRVRRKFGMLFQSAALFDSMTVAENIAFPLRRQGGLTEAEIARRVDEVLEVVGLPGAGPKTPAELSGGMRKRVGLARAVVYRPEILLYDEPTTGLDPVMSDAIDQLIIRVSARFQVTSVVVTHDLRSMQRVGTRLLLMHQGRIHAEASPEAMFHSSDPVVQQFVRGQADLKESAF